MGSSASSRVGCPHCGGPFELQLKITEGEQTIDVEAGLVKIGDREALDREVGRHVRERH